MKHSGFHRSIVAIAMMLIGWLPSLAHDFEVDGIFYNKTSYNTVAVTFKGNSHYSYSNEYSGDIVIPTSVKYNGVTYSVTSIGNSAFRDCPRLTSIEIPNSVTSIGNYAFSWCESLTSVEISNSVTSIGNYAFYYCKSLTSIEIPNSVTSIGEWALGYCSSLTSIQIPNSVTSIGNYAFYNCKSLTSIQIPNSVTSIGDNAFSYCSSLTSIQIPNSVTSIGGGVFEGCSSLTSIQIPNSVTSIGNYAFSGCSSLTSIEIPNSVKSIGDYAFCYCESLTSIQIPNSVTSIGDDAFLDCKSLTSIQIPNSVTSIGDYAFSGCSSLTSIQIPNSVTSIGQGAFKGCSSLTRIVVDTNNNIYDSRNGCNAIIETASNTLIAGCQNTIIPNSVTSIGNSAFSDCESLTSIEIPNSVTRIGNYAFWGCLSLTSIKIPNSVTSIGEMAFYDCDSLTSIKIPNSVTSIGDAAFYGCSGLTSIQIPNSVTNIGGYTFSYCSSLASIVIPNSVTSIGSGAFSYCSSLTKITCLATNPPTIESDTFNSYSAELYVPAGCISAYQSANYWKNFSNIIELEPELEEGMAFEYGGLTYKVTVKGKELAVIASESGEYSGAVVIPSSVKYNGVTYSVTSIGDYAFNWCTSLTSIEIPNSVTSIGNFAFYYCSSLTSIVIGNSVTSIGNQAFDGCSSLTSIEIPNSVTSIGNFAFEGCSSLTSIVVDSGNRKYDSRNGCNAIIETASNTLIAGCQNTIIPNSVTSIGDWAFCECSNLTSIEIPNSVTSIGEGAFAYCSSLTSIQIPDSVTSIGEYAFNCCDRLTKITCLATTPPTIESSTFSNYSAELYVPAGYKAAYQSAYYWKNFSNIIELEPELEEGMAFEYGGLTYKVTVKGKELAVIASESGEYSGAVVIPSSVNYNGITYSVTSIGSVAFSDCSSLTSIEIPNSVTSIGNYAFSYCESLTSIQIPNSVTSIGNYAFSYCESLTSIQIPNSVTSIGYGAFYWCSSLTSIVIGNSVTSIGNSAFLWCSSLTSILVDAGNTKYDSRNDCNAIIETASNTLIAGCQNTIIPNSVTSIGNDAFGGCTSLTSIEIPNSVTSIGIQAFAYCTSLTSIVVDSGNTKYDSRNGCNAIIETASNTLIAGCQNTIIPNSVTSIGNNAFKYCTSLTSIEIPNSVTSIGSIAFAYCTSLTNIEIPNSVTSIGDEAFYDCDRLTKITCLAITPPTIKSDTFNSYSAELYVPAGSISAYQSANHWKKFNIKEIVILSTSIALNQTTATLKATETLTLVATILTENATDKSVTWKSSNEAVATVDANGKVTAVAVGEATITATTADGSNKSATCKITVAKTLATSISLDKTSATLKATETLTLKATIAPATTTDKSVTWKSSNEAVATVDANGKVTAIAVGDATITATTIDGSNLSASCKVTVTSTLATSITLNHTEYEMVEKAEFQLSATILPEMTTNKSVVWSSSDAWVVPVDENGLVRAYSVGEAIITATTTDGSNLSASCKVVVKPTLATSITLNHTEYEMVEKAEFQLSATILPEMTTNKSVVWSSSDAWVAPVDENGLVRAYSVGEAVITATTIDGSNLSASCKVTVVSSLAQSITLDKTEVSLKATETATLVATVLPETTSNKGVEWTSSDESVAIVSKKGVVTAIAVGEAVITATTIDGTDLSASCKVTVVPTLAETITLDKTEISLEATETATLIAIVLPELATDKSVEWSSSDESVAVVDENGVVTAIAVGEATITATTTDGSNLSASCKVVVEPTLATSITLNHTEYEMVEKAEFQLTATILPELTTNKGVVWSSSNAWVASVDENGLVRAYSLGEAVITATTADGSNLSASCKVTVVSSLAQSITLDKTEVSLEATETAALVATVLPKLASNKSVEWSSSNDAIAVVDENGVVTAISIGEAIITATTADGSNLSASCKVSVIPTLAVSIELDQTEASVEEKSEFQLTATILPEHTTNKEVAWSSSKKVIATVDDTGLVFVKSVGEVVITATMTDGSNLSATCRINVYSGIDGVEGDDLIVATVGDNIVVKNAKLGSIVNVYASNGALVASEEATDGSVVVEAPVKGVYVVKVGKQTVKVII